MSTEGVTGENKSKQRKKKQDIIILETIKEIKDRKKVKANSGEKSTFCTYTITFTFTLLYFTCFKVSGEK